MQIKIGEIYKVKPEFRGECAVFKSCTNAKYIRYTNNNNTSITSYDILDENKNKIYFCTGCFEPKHLEPIEKTLYNLKIGDVVNDGNGNRKKVLGLIESSPENPIYAFSYLNDFKYFDQLTTAKSLEKASCTIVQPEPTEEIKEMTIEEVSKLVGKKVKIVE